MKRNRKFTHTRSSPPVTRRRKFSGANAGEGNSSSNAVYERPPRCNSPDDHCSICLGEHQNPCQPDNCFHKFCFDCLKEWSKRKAECPLCKKSFQCIYHSIVADDNYKIYNVPPQPANAATLRMGPGYLDFMQDFFGAHRRFFHYRPTLVPPSRPNVFGIRDWSGGASSADELPVRVAAAMRAEYPDDAQLAALLAWDPLEYRRTIYRHNLRPRPRDPSRMRQVSAAFFAANEAQLHRLAPFLNREFNALLPEFVDTSQITHIVAHVLEMLTRCEILSDHFRSVMSVYLGPSRANQLSDELHSFARSPHELAQYDASVVYERRLYDTPHMARERGVADRVDMERAFELMRNSRGVYSARAQGAGSSTSRGAATSRDAPHHSRRGPSFQQLFDELDPADIEFPRFPPRLAPSAATNEPDLNPETDFNFITGGRRNPALLDLSRHVFNRAVPAAERPSTPMSLSRLLSDSSPRSSRPISPVPRLSLPPPPNRREPIDEKNIEQFPIFSI